MITTARIEFKISIVWFYRIFFSPLLLIKKKNNPQRLCADYKQLISFSIKNKFFI